MNIGVMNTWLCVLLFGTAYSTIHKSKDGLFDIHHKMSNDELLKYFGVSTSDNVPEYDISYPMPANEEGNLISRERAKRDVDQYSQNKYYHMSAFGRTLHLNVTVNENLLGPNFYIETRNKDGSKTFADAPHRNFYHGHVVSQPNSFVALSDNEGVSGAIRVADDEMLFVHPLPDNLLPARDQSNEKRPHLVVKRSTSDFRQMFEEEDPPEMAEDWRYAEYRYPADAPQPDHKFLEVIYVGDHLITQQIGLFELPEMLLIIGNIVSRMFTDSTFGERKLTYTVTKVLILNNGELDYSKSASNGAKLSVFGRWLKANNPADDKDPEHSDTGTLFTSYTGGGLALAGGMCSYRDMRAIVGSIGLSSSAIVAHENFHNLGFGHDVDGGCPNGANIMSTYVPSGHAAFTWSNCSRQYIQRYLRSRWSHCLNDAPQAKRPTLPPLLRGQLPGTIFDGDKQCELKHSVGYKQCFKNGCGTLFCTNNGVSCHSSGGTPADGTRCGEGKWCIRGECVDNGLPPVHGNWGSWSDYTSCTRTCGGGIKHRERKCDNPRPQNKGNPCSGSNIGEYKTCNTKACLIGSKSFREVQCKEKNVNYTAHLASGNVCSLWCRRGNIAYLRGKVKDGTRCSNDPMNLNVCVNGECQIVGCDNQLYSEKVYDRCHTCDGDGSKCELRTVNYTKNHRKYGAKKGDTMVVLKKGSSNIHAKMRGKTWNVIGVQNATGEYLINLPSWSKTVYKAGAKIAYIHRKNQYDDEIIITGRVTEELRLVFVYIRTRNQGVDIKYYSPLKNATKPSKEMFYWTSGEWSVCSKTCAGGQVQRKVSCLRHDDDSQVTNTACSEKSKPLSKKSCSTQDCPPEWHSSLTSCSKTCGKGVQLRKTVCRQKDVKSWTIVENSRCVQPPPTDLPIERFCNKITCPPQYVALPWSQCSTTCGKGVMTRALKCEILNDAGITDTLPNETCEHHNAVKPSTKEKCNYDKPCEHTPQYVKIGCFKDRYGKRRVLNWIVSLRPEIDWWNPGATIKKCARLAREHSQVYFAIQFYGECWASSDPNVKYDKYGVSKNSWKGLGGSWTNCVYKLLKKKSA